MPDFDVYDEAHDLDDAHDLRMAVMDRLLDYEPAPSLVSLPAAPPRSSSARGAIPACRRRPKNLDERAARAALYGPGTRSGTVDPATVRVDPCSTSFQYEQTDVPPGLRLCDWRSQRNATAPVGAGAAA